ncbi:MAG: hypothetical protein V2I33_01065 [Kangiellaceae bacterium]|jgi:hypothetical protein|nr:hypothetical protein [Kangiellaceae bacterium]
MAEQRTLEQQREDFSNRRLIATPIAGMIAWAIIGISSLFLESFALAMVLFIATGSIVYLGMFISKFTGENFLEKNKPKNTFDVLFFYSVGMAVLVYSIAIPFFMIVPSSLPMTVGILSGLMWLPISWIIKHWIGLVHGLARTIFVLAAWYLFPEQQYLAISTVIVILYIFAITVLETRYRSINRRR